MADAKRVYEAQFKIGAQIAGSFRGAIATARARLSSLASMGKRVIGVMGGLLKAFGGLFAIAGTFAAGAVLGKIFGGAVEEAQEAADRTRELTTTLMKNEKMRKAGLAVAQQQTKYIQDNNALIEKQGVLSQDHLDNMSKQLALYRLSPQRIMDASKAMADQLVYAKGARATEEDATGFAVAHGKAIMKGQVKALEKYNIYMTKSEAKEFQVLAKAGKIEEAHKKLMAIYKKAAGENAKALDTPTGKMVNFQKAMKNLSQDIGREMLPALGEVADAWRKIIETPTVRNALLAGTRAMGSALVKISHYVADDLLPAFEEFAKSESFRQMVDLAGKFVGYFADFVKTIPAEMNKLWADTLKDIEIILTVLATVDDKFKEPLQKVIEMQSRLNNLQLPKEAMAPTLGKISGVGPEAMLAEAPIHPEYPDNLKASAKAVSEASEAWKNYKANIAPVAPEQASVMGNLKNIGEWASYYGSSAWSGVKDALIVPFESLKAVTAGVQGNWDEMWTHAANAQQGAQDGLNAVGNSLKNMVLQPLTDSLNAWNNLKNAMQNGLPAVSAPVAATPAASPAPAAVPGMQFGGIVRSPTLAMIGERGPEAVIPLSGGGMATSVNFAPTVNIAGNASEAEQRAMDSRLRDLARDFIEQFKRAQHQERRLSYESGSYA